MQVDDAGSSSSISSPPISPQNHNGLSDTIRVARPSNASNPRLGEGVVSGSSAHAAIAANTAAHAANGHASTLAPSSTNGAAPEKPKRQRKKKEPELGPDGKPKLINKKPRKPRELKDKTAVPTAARKKQKIEEKPANGTPVDSRQPTITEMVNSYHGSSTSPSMPMPPRPQFTASDATPRNSLPQHLSNPPTPRPISSGQNYDPVRGYDPVRAATMESAQSRPANGRTTASSAHTSPHVNKASASPSIASLIDPPAATKTSVPHMSYALQTPAPPSLPPQHRSPTLPRSTPATLVPPPQPSPTTKMHTAPISNHDGAMEIDLKCDRPSKPAPPEIKAPSKSSSSAPTPKAARPSPSPKGTGSGLLSSSDLFGGPSSNTGSERKAIDIDLHIPLNPQGGNTVNIAQEIVKKYGRDAINPRAAAHRERLLQVQAAQNRLEGGSADDMSVDLMSEPEGDSNVEMGGMEDEKSVTGLDGEDKPKRKRRKKVEEYDKEDDFIDDAELAWQEQAAVAKDGFFVYSGPLIPEGQAAQVESSAPTRGGRGRGRGRGRGAAATGTTHASLAEKNRDPNAPARGGRGRGRGTGVPRKPRITKADRERMEAEKIERERAAANINGTGAAPPVLAPSPSTHPSYTQQQPLSTTV